MKDEIFDDYSKLTVAVDGRSTDLTIAHHRNDINIDTLNNHIRITENRNLKNKKVTIRAIYNRLFETWHKYPTKVRGLMFPIKYNHSESFTVMGRWDFAGLWEKLCEGGWNYSNFPTFKTLDVFVSLNVNLNLFEEVGIKFEGELFDRKTRACSDFILRIPENYKKKNIVVTLYDKSTKIKKAKEIIKTNSFGHSPTCYRISFKKFREKEKNMNKTIEKALFNLDKSLEKIKELEDEDSSTIFDFSNIDFEWGNK